MIRVLFIVLLLVFHTCILRAQRGYFMHALRNLPSMGAAAVSGAANGAGDVMQFWYSSSVFPQSGAGAQFWNPDLSWRNKWRLDESGEVARPLQERFWGSSRWFVATTDGWHMTKSIQLTAQHAAIVMYKPEPVYRLSWDAQGPAMTRAKWWWKPADFILHRAAFAVGWHASTRLLRTP
jgi:hypothetical protein